MAENEIEEKIEAAAERFEIRLKDWMKNDRFFDGFRNTYARVLLYVLGNLTLFGGLIYCFSESSGLLIYAVLVLLTVLSQKLSVRFVFDTDADELVDEYQRARRDRSYRRAYRNVAGAFTGLIACILVVSYFTYFVENKYFTFWPTVMLDLNLDTYRTLVVLVFLMGFFTLQPYFAWGFKGEPWRSKDEPND